MVIPEIRKILYATDLSENARQAFGYAAAIANRFGAGITIIHVIEELPADSMIFISHVFGKEKWEEIKEKNKYQAVDEIKKRVEKFCMEVSSELPECPFITDEIIVDMGHPVEKILRWSEGFDLVVMGSHGHGFLADATMGSISRRVLRRCKKPVMIVRLPEANLIKEDISNE